MHQDGVLCLKGLKQHIQDPCLLVVYVQTLSITDGITDPLSEAISIIEEENQRRKRAAESNSGGSYLPITLITDSCLAFSVLLHNDGERYQWGQTCFERLVHMGGMPGRPSPQDSPSLSPPHTLPYIWSVRGGTPRGHRRGSPP